MRIVKNKSTIKQHLQVEIQASSVRDATSVIIDGAAILWVVHWLINGKLQNFVQNVISYVSTILRNAGVFLIFDRYKDYSKKCDHSSRKQVQT